MGLPTVASDIPAHREFPIFTSDSVLSVCNWLADEVKARTAATRDRRPVVYDWEEHATRFCQVVDQLIERSARPDRRSRANGGLGELSRGDCCGHGE
jgi:hypothetical protein